MDVIISRFNHIADKIFEQLDIKSIKDCREVCKLWQEQIDNKKFLWIPIAIKLLCPSNFVNGNTYLHVAAKSGHSKMFEAILINEDMKSPTNHSGHTPFHLICAYGHSNLARTLIQNPCVLDANNKWII